MGYYTTGREIRNYEPDNSGTEFYTTDTYSNIGEILGQAAEHFGCSVLDLLSHAKISAEYIHTHCLGYDRYDPSDYTRYILITYTKD